MVTNNDKNLLQAKTAVLNTHGALGMMKGFLNSSTLNYLKLYKVRNIQNFPKVTDFKENLPQDSI